MWWLPSFLVSPIGSNMGQSRDKYLLHSCLLPLLFYTCPYMLQTIDYQPNIWNRCSQVRRHADALCHPEGSQNHLKSSSILRDREGLILLKDTMISFQHFTLPLFLIQWPHASIQGASQCSPSPQTPHLSLLLKPHVSPSCFGFIGAVFLTKKLDV